MRCGTPPGTTVSCQHRHSSAHRYSVCTRRPWLLGEESAENLQRSAKALGLAAGPGSCLWTERGSSACIWDIRKVDADCCPGLQLALPGLPPNINHPGVHLWAFPWGPWLELIAQDRGKGGIGQKTLLSTLFSAAREAPLPQVSSFLPRPGL